MRVININGFEHKLFSYGYCQCGCGQKTLISPYSNKNDVKGKPRKFLHGHFFKSINGLNKHPLSTGGRTIIKGYVYIYLPDHPHAVKQGYVAEHRLIMEKQLGRYLHNKEVVHHKNGNKQDNAIDNLKIYYNSGKHLVKEHLGRNLKTGQFISIKR